MNKNTRQTKPLGRSTKEDNAGLSLQHSQLFTVVNDTYKYYNEIVENVSDFLGRLTSKKFKNIDVVCFGYLPTKKSILHFSVWFRDSFDLLDRKSYSVKF